jgi:hypothetical protein
MRPIERAARAVSGFFFASEDARRLAALRIGLCSLLAVRLAINDYGAVAGQPASLYQPLSYMHLLSAMPSHEVASTAQAIGIATALLAAAGLWIRGALPVAFASALLLNGMLNATGKPVHNDVTLMLCLIPLLVAPTASTDVWTLRGLVRRLSGSRSEPRSASARAQRPLRGEAYGWQIRAAMTVVALAYFFVGFQKLRYSGIAWATSDNLRWVLYASKGPYGHPDALALFVADRAWLSHLFAGATLLVETCFPLVLFVPRLRWLFIPAVIGLHIGIRLTLGLDYSAWWLTVLIVFVDWPAVVDWIRSRVGQWRPRVGETAG